jgi:5-bromo-4-chloroindolyl phosphate hydrolysis protein
MNDELNEEKIEMEEIKHDDDIHFIKNKLEEIELKIFELQKKMNDKDDNIENIRKLENSFSLLKKLYYMISSLCSNLKN